MDHPGAALGEGHQVDLVRASLTLPRQRPSGRARFVADATRPAKLFPIDGLELLADQAVERHEQLKDSSAVVFDPALEVEIGFGHRHVADNTFSPRYPQIVDKNRS